MMGSQGYDWRNWVTKKLKHLYEVIELMEQSKDVKLDHLAP